MPPALDVEEAKQPLLSAEDKQEEEEVSLQDEEAGSADAKTQQEEQQPAAADQDDEEAHLEEQRAESKPKSDRLAQTKQFCAHAFFILQELLAIPVIEALGTLTLTLVVALLSRPAAATAPLTAALVIAAVLLAMIYAGARISGAHYNPAVTFSLLLLGRTSAFQSLVYMGSQLAGAIGGAYLAKALSSPDPLADPFLHGGMTGKLALVEISFSFALVFVILHTVLARTQQPNSFAGAAICATLAAAVAVGAVMNPAVSTGLYVVGTGEEGAGEEGGEEGLWIRWVLPMVGALVATCLFYLTNPADAMFPPGQEEAAAAAAAEAAASSRKEGRGRGGRTPLLRDGSSSSSSSSSPTFPSSSSSSSSIPPYSRVLFQTSRLLSVYLMEFQGTFLLTLTIALSLTSTPSSLAPSPAATAGLLLTGLIFAGGYVSGAHLNPAITLGVFLFRPRRKDVPKALLYVIVQVLASVLAAGATRLALGHAAGQNALPSPQTPHKWQQALGAEIVFTALLVLVILLLGAAGAQGHQYFGLAIGAALTSGLYAAGGISGGGLNPAVASGLYAMNASKEQGEEVWVYWVGPLFGAVVGVLMASGLAPGGRVVGRRRREGRRGGEEVGGEEEVKEEEEKEGEKEEGKEEGMEKGEMAVTEEEEGKKKEEEEVAATPAVETSQ